MTPLQRKALQMCLEYIETDAHERRHVRWKINEALAEPATEEFSAVQPAAQPQQEPKKDLMFSTVAMQERHDERIGRIVNTLDQVKQEQQPAQPQQEPVDFASLLREAEEIVQSKPTWKRFIDATPLANDIAVWMTVFAQDVALRNAASTGLCHYREPLTDEEIKNIAAQTLFPIDFARAIEAAHGIKENT